MYFCFQLILSSPNTKARIVMLYKYNVLTTLLPVWRNLYRGVCACMVVVVVVVVVTETGVMVRIKKFMLFVIRGFAITNK